MSLRSHVSYASGYLELGMIREAVRELAGLDRHARSTPAALKVKLEIDRLGGDWKGMRHCGRLLVKLEPENVQNWISFAYATRRASTLRSARRILLRAHQIHPEEPIVLFNLSCYASQLGDFSEATRYLVSAIALAPACQELALEDPDLAPLRSQVEAALS